MKILVIGLDGADPDLLLADERLANIRGLMEAGCYGRLESIVPPITVPAWICMATSRDPGSIGVYGFRDRADRSYDKMSMVESRTVGDLTIWDQIAREGKRTVLVGVPPGFPARKLNGVTVGCFLTPDPAKNTYTHPAKVADTIKELVGPYPVDVHGFRDRDKGRILDDIRTMNRKQFEVFRHFLQNEAWDYAQIVAIGLDRLQHAFWSDHDPAHHRHDKNSPFKSAIRDFYRELDEEVGRVLDGVDGDTMVLVVSDHGARRLDGGFAVNQWLVEQGILALDQYPDKLTPFNKLPVSWGRTVAWSEGGYYSRVYLNVQGREPNGVVDPKDYEEVRDDLKARFEAITDAEGRPIGTQVFKPEQIYREVRGVAPDLIVHFGGLSWRASGGVGYPSLHIFEDETGADDSNHAQHGSFVLVAPGNPLAGEVEGARLLDVAPTLLDLGGYDIPPSMQGRSLVAGMDRLAPATADEDDEETVRSRLSGLGYLS